jgi:hypothetical protein
LTFKLAGQGVEKKFEPEEEQVPELKEENSLN